jgi:2-dehydropantoate 2-reductase
MTHKILFVGAGAIAGYLGAFLARAGHDVTLVDAWGEQIETIRRQGIAVTGPHEPFAARPAAVHLHEAQRLPRDFAIAIVALKVYDTAWATQLAIRHLAPDGYVVAAQNCWPDPVVAAIAGRERAVGLVMSRIGVAAWAPGRVERGMAKGAATGHNVFRAGEHDGRTSPRVRELAAMLSVIDGAQVTDNLWGERWAKLCANAMSNPVQALSGLTADEIVRRDDGRALTIQLAAETARVGLALGYRLPAVAGQTAETWADAARPETWHALDGHLTPTAPPSRGLPASMAQDVAKGRPTEIDEMNGFVVTQGRACGVATPVSAAVVDLVRAIDRGTRRPSPENIAEILRNAAVADRATNG